MIDDNKGTLNHVFTSHVIYDLIRCGYNRIFDDAVKICAIDPCDKTYGHIFKDIYAYLEKNHRNEYFYTNALLNILRMGSDPTFRRTALRQVRIGCHIADVAIFDGFCHEGAVYEIKSDLDDFGRLYEQIHDYYTAFSKVIVVVDNKKLSHLIRLLGSFGNIGWSVGIYAINAADGLLSYKKAPDLFDDCLDHAHIFKLLRKYEYKEVILNHYYELPEVAPVFYFRACLDLFQTIPIKMAQKLAFNQLQKRIKIAKDDFERIQPELKAVAYLGGITLDRKLPQLETLLKSTYGSEMER